MKTRRNGVKLDDILRQDLKRPGFKKHFDEADFEVRLAIQIAKAREDAHMTQANLAKKMGTKQQTISRIEKGKQNLTVATLRKIAQAVGSDLIVQFRPCHSRSQAG